MRKITISIIATILVLTACRKDKVQFGPNDIKFAANKVDVQVNELPESAVTFIKENYRDKYISDAKLVPNVGFELGLRNGTGLNIGVYSTAYFFLESPAQYVLGRAFYSTGDCFEFVYPITYIMDDGTEITGNNVETKVKIKEWYANNPEVKEAANIKFPFEVVYADSNVISINNEEEKTNICL